MAGPIKLALVEMGYRVREYCPVGELLPGMSYLVRRLLENTSNEGFPESEIFRQRFRRPAAAARSRLTNWRDALRRVRRIFSFARRSLPQWRLARNSPGDTYENAPLVNFVHRSSQEQMRTALREMRGRLGQKYPLVIDGQKIWTGSLINSINPSSPKQIVGVGH